MATQFYGQPGIYTGPALKSRNIFTSFAAPIISVAPDFAFIDGTYTRDTGEATTTTLRAGLIVGKITTTSGGTIGYYRNSIIGATTAAYTSGGTSLTVTAAVATEVARLITLAGGNVTLNTIGPPTTAGTVAVTSTTCSAASGTTLTVSSLGVNKAAGSAICPADGSQVPLTILPGPYPIDVADANSAGSFIQQPIMQWIRSADLIATQVINLVADDFSNTFDTSVTTYWKNQLGTPNNTAALITFDNSR